MKLPENKILLTIAIVIILILSASLYFFACGFYFHKLRSFAILNFSNETLQIEVSKGDEFIFDLQIDKNSTQTIKKYVPRPLPYQAKIKGETFNIDAINYNYDEGEGFFDYNYKLIYYIVITENKEVVFQELIPVE